MQNFGCEKCEPWNTERPIRTPGEFITLIAQVSEAVKSGLLVVRASKDWVGDGSFADLVASATWPDLVSHAFACSVCGQEFELSVEIYHGSGGAWTPRKSRS